LNPALSLSQKILRDAHRKSASDIHFFPSSSETHVYFRILGRRVFHQTIINSEYQLMLTYYKYTSGMDIGEIRKPQNGIINEIINEVNVALRLSTLPVHPMESLAIRILPQNETDSLDSLFLFSTQKQKLKNYMGYSKGVTLFTGPTGCGKTTALYALLKEVLNEKHIQAITLEDPIEKRLTNILQVEINEKAGITYQEGLKAALRHDPDIIMVGEIRDDQTAQFAFEAALTGHLVLSTIHAKNTYGTIPRLLDLGVKKDMIRQSLNAVVALELLPIVQHQEVKRRAAILELLEGNMLKQYMRGKPMDEAENTKQSFHHLRKKAYAYGFIEKKTYFS